MEFFTHHVKYVLGQKRLTCETLSLDPFQSRSILPFIFIYLFIFFIYSFLAKSLQ